MIVWDGEIRPRTVEEVRTFMFERSTRDNKRALLRLHTDRTIAAASKALTNPWKWAGRYDAAKILIAAAPRYVWLGGDLEPWKGREDSPADWEVEAAARQSYRPPARHGVQP